MKLSPAILVALGVATIFVFANCQSANLEPVAIEANDMCAFCRMSISEKRYAAELIDQDGEVFKFDDIGCMANFMKQKNNDGSIRASFVMDFERREWLKAGDAFYVRSPEFRTPMSGGIVAFHDESTAQAAATKYHGTMLRFAELGFALKVVSFTPGFSPVGRREQHQKTVSTVFPGFRYGNR